MSIPGRFNRLIISSALLVTAALAASFILITSEQQRLYNLELMNQLLTEARLMRLSLREEWPNLSGERASAIIWELAEQGMLAAVVSADRTLLIDSPLGSPGLGLLESDEVRQALVQGWGTAVRPYGREGAPHAAVAVRIGTDKTSYGVVWLARPLWRLGSDRQALGRMLAILGMIAAVSIATVVAIVVRVRRRALRRVLAAARDLSSGSLTQEVEVTGTDELAALASSLNVVKRRLAESIEAARRQGEMLQALVDQLGEGVVVARPDGRIVLVNPAALRLLDLDRDPRGSKGMIGQPVEACIPQRLLQRMLLGDEAQQRELAGRSGAPIVIDGEVEEADDRQRPLVVEGTRGTRHLLAHVTDLSAPGAAGGANVSGRVLVLTDVSQLQQAVQMRTDFVANASHELRTPLSTIRAAVETLLTMDLASESVAAGRFLEKIDRHSARLIEMVVDLLDLSRLESPGAKFEPEWLEGSRIGQDLAVRFGEAVERKGLKFSFVMEPARGCRVHVNPHLLRLALDNLVDNAIKFTEAGGAVQVAVRRGESDAAIEVADGGCGIPPEDRQRVFERFYQVQRGRGGSPNRGTGLGLAIVRHAVSAMAGQVELRSELGRGTTVTIRLRQPPPPKGRAAGSGVGMQGIA